MPHPPSLRCCDRPAAEQVPTDLVDPRPSRARIPLQGPRIVDPVTLTPRRANDCAAAAVTTYTVEVERTLPLNAARTADHIARTLDDPRGWVTALAEDLDQVAPRAGPDLRILVATWATTYSLCVPLQTLGRVLCRNSELVVTNALRWDAEFPTTGRGSPPTGVTSSTTRWVSPQARARVLPGPR